MRIRPSIPMLALAAVMAMPAALAQRTEPPTAPPPPTSGTTDTMPKSLSFADLDVNADGKISKDEAAADAKLTSHFAMIDRDGDGQVSETEFATGHDRAKQY